MNDKARRTSLPTKEEVLLFVFARLAAMIVVFFCPCRGCYCRGSYCCSCCCFYYRARINTLFCQGFTCLLYISLALYSLRFFCCDRLHSNLNLNSPWMGSDLSSGALASPVGEALCRTVFSSLGIPQAQREEGLVGAYMTTGYHWQVRLNLV